MSGIGEKAYSLAKLCKVGIDDINDRTKHIKMQSDFFSGNFFPFSAAAIVSGTSTLVSGTAKHPGIYDIQSSTSANSGYRYNVNTGALILSGEESFAAVFKTGSALEDTVIRIGFADTLTHSDAIDGCYVEIVAGLATGKTSKASTRSETSTTYQLSADTWYRIKIDVNEDATKVDFTIYADDSLTVLWTDALTTNIPIAETGVVCVATHSSTSAKVLCYIDYLAFTILKARIV